MKKLIISLLCFGISTPALAVKILSVKDARVILDTEGSSLNVGDKFVGRDSSGKAKVLLEVKQIKNDRALATAVKGRAQVDLALSPYNPKPGGSSASASSGGSKKSSSKSSGGIMVGLANNTMTVKPSGASSISLTGTSFSVSGMYQMPVEGAFGARLLVGYETLTAKGDASTAVCTGSTSCEVDISYLGIEALAKYAFVQNRSMDFWAGAGLGFLVAMSKSSNILDTGKISTNQTIVGALGLDWHLSPTSFVPLQFDYAVYPDNATSSATQMILRAGYGFAF